ncbi:MAG: hypothetical protein JNL93_24495 [Pelomonas sp.]|nr:hypothetical protein [Roseateles sp.]
MKALLPLLLVAAQPAFAQTADAARCPQAGEQLSEYLASARQRIGDDGEVRVEFDVDARGRAQLRSVDGTRRYLTPVRIAVDSLDCQAGAPQRYVLHVRFADRSPTLASQPASAASATVARADASR